MTLVRLLKDATVIPAETIHALRTRVGGRRILAVLEPRSNTMKLGTMKDRLAGSLAEADRVYCYAGRGVAWEPAEALAAHNPRFCAVCLAEPDALQHYPFAASTVSAWDRTEPAMRAVCRALANPQI